MTKAYIVNHTHWDREWYFTTADALTLSEQLFTEVLSELEKNKDANFCLDGQTSVVDEYVEIHPEAKERIKKLVAEGRLFVGPWYTQTDALIPDAESIVRNLVIGINDTKQNYGNPMMAGYLPDTFGFNAQMPTLLQQVGIDNFVFWRGTNFRLQMNSVYFKWHGLSDKEVYAANFPFGYFTAQITTESKRKLKQFVKERYDPSAEFEATHHNNDEVLMPSGIDQMNIVKDMSETVSNLNKLSKVETHISTYPDFIDKLRKRKDLPSYQGELRLPTYSRVHRTIGSVRHRNKIQNFDLEQKILRRVEPLVVIAKKNGIDIGNGLLIKLWKKLLECQAHDTIGGSVSDNVAVDINHRFKEANEIADGVENMIEKKLAEYLELDDHDVLILNTDPSEFHGIKEISIVTSSKNVDFDGLKNPVIMDSKHFPARHHILMMTPKGQEYTDEPEYFQLKVQGRVDLPGLGYKVIHFTDAQKAIPELGNAKISGNSIEKNGHKIEFVNGAINLKTNGIMIPDVVRLVDSANDGDTYDYSPLENDQEKELTFDSSFVNNINNQPYELVVSGSSRLPLKLVDREKTDPTYGFVDYKLYFTFLDNGMLNAKLVLNNQVYSHRLRLQIKPSIHTQEAVAHIQDGFIKTSNQVIDKNWQKEFVEKPVNIYNFDKTVTITDKNKYLTFFGKGLKEYEFKDEKLFITLMATTSQLGKRNLAWRPGRASGDTTNQGHVMMATPMAEELGLNEFEFGIVFDDQPFSEQEVSEKTRDWLSQSVSYQTQKLNYFINRLDNKIWGTENNPQIPNSYSLLNLDKRLIVSAIYPSYQDQDSYIIRIQNPTGKDMKLPDDLFRNAEFINALEEKMESKKFIGTYDMISLKLKY
ncbi:glycosyl hydrolase, family 38 [Pediococcus damnosus]|uniref:alpha-mannosidase n=1 Tax=Pediococcus damnosus TaxID=51663 RepID=UPI00078B3543|nr:alpha-mannosidase [Pediococcus damnosus]AMV60683.1 glycosyl hydrolase, family 38 [Pediococcus damnosus]AMV64997.1 glycosyl hydrolase, family 38 [Pediococcus damnosus]